MRFIMLTSLFSMLVSAQSYKELSTPRDTFKTFLKSMVMVKSNNDVSESYDDALSALDLSKTDSAVREDAGKKYADELIWVFDRLEKVDYSKIPTELEEKKWVYDKRDDLEISVIKTEEKWKFSHATLLSLKGYKKVLKDKATVNNVIRYESWRESIRKKLPNWMNGNILLFEIWQLFFLFIIIAIAYVLERFIVFLTSIIVNNNIKLFKFAPPEVLQKLLNPIGKMLLVYIFYFAMPYLDLEPSLLAVLKRGCYIVLSVFAVWLGHVTVDTISYYLKEKAAATSTKFDDIIIPLFTKTSYVIVYAFGALLVASSLTFDVTGMIAGLGIGGLAFAFAAKDTLANFFGSIMLVLDRPFDIGDVIRSGELEGTVIEVGFRSTRIKTFYDSVITVSNGDLINRSIDNLGKRQYRRLSTTLGVEYDTPPEKIEAFCEGIRQIILEHKWTRKDYFNVYFSGYGASSLDISLMVFWETDDYTRELNERHRLNIDILRLAKELEVNFAFPTQTVHLFKEVEKPTHKNLDKYIDEGITLAHKVVKKPFSLRNPRSNAGDKEQFGNNDFGL